MTEKRNVGRPSKFSPQEEQAIRDLYKNGDSYYKIAKDKKTAINVIIRIVKGGNKDDD